MSILTAVMGLGKAADTDNAKTYLDTTLPAALDVLDAHNHDGSTGGNAVAAAIIAAANPTAAGALGYTASHLNYGDGSANHTLVTLDQAQTITGVKTFSSAPIISTITNGAATLTLPSATDTLVGRATTDTLTNKTLTSAIMAAATPTGAGAVGFGSGHLNVGDGAANHVLVDRDSAEAITGVKTFSTAPVVSTITNGGATLTLPTTTDTIVGRATTDTLSNKTLTSPAVTNPTISGTVAGSATYTSPTLASPAFSGTPTGDATLKPRLMALNQANSSTVVTGTLNAAAFQTLLSAALTVESPANGTVIVVARVGLSGVVNPTPTTCVLSLFADAAEFARIEIPPVNGQTSTYIVTGFASLANGAHTITLKGLWTTTAGGQTATVVNDGRWTGIEVLQVG